MYLGHVGVPAWGGGDWPGSSSFGWPWPGLIWLIVAMLFWGGLIALLVWAIRSTAGTSHTYDTAREVLRRRFAAGEISSEEYTRIEQILRE